MKYIILKAQETRELEDLGGLTITKPFKTASPYIEGVVLEQIDGGNWRLIDDTRRRGKRFCPACPIWGRSLYMGTVD